MIKKRLLMCALYSLLFLALASSFVLAGRVITPGTDATVAGTAVVLNATNNTIAGLVNCTFYALSTLTANSTWTSLVTVSNNTGNQSSLNATFDSIGLEDANNYQFNATCRNLSNFEPAHATTTGIDVDNTAPGAPTAVSPTTDTDGSVSFSGTVIGRNTTSCTLTFETTNPGSRTYDMTHSADSCTLTQTVPEGTYRYVIQSNDGTNSTNSSVVTLGVDVATSAGKAAWLASQKGVKRVGPKEFTVSKSLLGGNSALTVAIVVLAIVFVIYIAIRSMRFHIVKITPSEKPNT